MRTYIFNDNGLRFEVSYLKMMKKKILELPIEQQAEFVDSITHRACLTGAYLAVGNSFSVDQVNCTSVGNLAYVILYHPDATLREHAKSIHDLICKK